MKDEQILKKAIEKAGYSIDYPIEFEWSKGPEEFRKFSLALIFSHSFAKAFFGAEWENNLMSMVREEQPLKYIEKFI